MREPGLSFARLLSSRVRLPAYAFMRTLGQENGSCQTQIFTAVYLFFPLTQIQPLPNSQGKPCAQGVCWVQPCRACHGASGFRVYTPIGNLARRNAWLRFRLSRCLGVHCSAEECSTVVTVVLSHRDALRLTGMLGFPQGLPSGRKRSALLAQKCWGFG